MSLKWTIFLLCLFVLAISVLLSNITSFTALGEMYSDTMSKVWGKKNVDLAICIMSSRENFAQRDSIRQSWLLDIAEANRDHEKTIIAKFVVGKRACPYSKVDRVDAEACDRWKPSLPSDSKKEGIPTFVLGKEAQNKPVTLVTSLYFKTLHEVVLQRFGIAEFLLNKTSGRKLNSVLYDLASDEELVRVAFSLDKPGHAHMGYNYRPVPQMTLPKGYEFLLELDVPALNDRLLSQVVTTTDYAVKEDHGQLFKIEYVQGSGTRLVPAQNISLLPLVSLMFTVHHTDSLIYHMTSEDKRDLRRSTDVRTDNERLKIEQELHNDLLMVDMLDVYRNLPEKLLNCHTWLNANFHSTPVMKTDDDSWVNIRDILVRLEKNKDIDSWWWGSFRQRWQVERHGKWREPVYSSTVYPAFACGSGNIVSYDLHVWLAENAAKLRRFQGEDVSMGIWLSGLEVQYEDDRRWQCDQTCQANSLVITQLTPEKVVWHWNNSRKCEAPCNTC